MLLKRILAWIVFSALFGAWLFSASIWPGNSAIYNAVVADDAKEISHLLAQGADPNSQSEPLTLDRNRTELKKYRYPPLIYALRHGRAAAALALVEGGANPNTLDEDGKSALDMATSQHLDQLSNALIQRSGTSHEH